MALTYSLLGGISLLMVWQDVRSQVIPLWQLCLFIMISGYHSYFYPNPEGLWVAGIIFVLFLGCQIMFWMFFKKLVMGWGDLILGPICGLWIFADELAYYILSIGLIGLGMGLIWYKLWESKTFPFVPSLLGGQGIIFLIRCFSNSNGL